MATSGSKSVSVTSWDTLKFSWSEVSQSVDNNSTTISWKMELVAGDYGRINSNPLREWEVTVNGTKYTGSVNVSIGNNATKTLASGTTTIAHNSDGTKTFSYSFSQYFAITFSGVWIATVSGSGSGTLDTIARASQPSCITWPEHTQNVGSFGDEIAIHMNRKSSNFTHTVRYQFGTASGTIATGVGTGTTWVIPLSLMDLIPTTTSGSGTIYVDTYNGSTKVGTKSCGFTATVPASVKPTCTFVLEDITNIDDVYGSPVKGLSKIKVTVTGKTAYSSPIASYEIVANGVRYTSSTATTGVLNTSGKSTVTAKVTDKRGRVGTATYDMNVLAYTQPTISKLDVRRCNEDGTANDDGEYVKATFSAAVSSMSNKNTVTYRLAYRESSGGGYTTVSLAELVNQYSVTDYEYIFPAVSESSYVVIVEATDKHKTAARTTSASTAFTLIDFHPSGNGMAFGRMAEKENTLQIGLDVEFMGQITGSIFDAILPVGSVVLRYDHINPNTLYPGTTWQRIYGAFPWFTDGNGQIGLTGGEREVTLKVSNLPAHDHGGTYTNAGTATKTHSWLASGGSAMTYEAVSVGDGDPHNNMPPYIQISAWRRTA